MPFNLLRNNKKKYLLLLVTFILFDVIVFPTYAKFASGYTTSNDVVSLSLDFNISIFNIEEYEVVVVPAGSYKMFNVKVSNTTDSSFDNGGTIYYGVWYRMNPLLDNGSDVVVAKVEGTDGKTSGELSTGFDAIVSIIIINNSDSEVMIDVGVSSSVVGVSSIEYLSGKRLITGSASPNIELFDGNVPNLDNGNLLPVYYDDTEGIKSWKKADSTNENNSWYDYENKMWANAVILDPNSETDYSKIAVGDSIQVSDIVAFYVWIPRFKYRVWNLNRQGTTEDTSATEANTIYAYSAYSEGIDILFEEGTNSTGNVECIYDTSTSELATNLSDNCYYKDSLTPIKTTDLNTDYTDAWYTHPAFTFGGEEKEGFWIGKFETSGSMNAPKIIPDAVSLTNQNLSVQFTTSKLFQNYLSDNVDAHMVTNLEWGAVAYLSHSDYGLCDDSNCQGIDINNSSGYYTGRSGGAIAGSDELKLSNVYNTSSTAKYNSYGYYNYKGYKIDNSTGVADSSNVISKVASTTGNINGVYDMSGGAYEYVMGNMVNSNNVFYPSSAGTNWNKSTTLDTKYYNSYSYGTNNSGTIAFNRGRLGDATAEVLGGLSNISSWKPGSGINNSYSYFVSNYNSWFYRGGYYENDYSDIFYFYRYSGFSYEYFTFRSSLI